MKQSMKHYHVPAGQPITSIPSPATVVGHSAAALALKLKQEQEEEEKAKAVVAAAAAMGTTPGTGGHFGCTISGCNFTGTFEAVEKHEAAVHSLYSCAKICGFSGTWDVVENHEKTCTHGDK